MDENHLYEAEVSPKEVLKYMKTNIYDNYFKNSHYFISSDYILSRSSLFSLIRKISNKLGFKSQTFFLSIYYLDILFSKNKKIDCNVKILGLACLLLSAKYVENDPCVPNLATFIKAYNNAVGYKYIISVTDLFYAEVLTCKMLGYKLNYYTIYDFDSFFFGHGIIKMEQLRDINNENYSNLKYTNFEINATNSIFIRKILEKIYRKSRHYLELIVNNSNICLKYNSLLISIFIMKKSVEEILFDEQRINKHDLLNKEKFMNKTSKCFKEIMKELYQIDYESMEDYNELIADKDLIKLLQEEKKADFSPVLVDLENNIKLANDNSYNNRNSVNLRESQNTISSYSHLNRFIPKYNISLNNNSNTIENGSKILQNINITRNENNFSRYKSVYSHSSYRISSNQNNRNTSISKKPVVSNYIDISNLSSSKELNKMEPNNINFNDERSKRALSRHSDLNQIKYLQKLTTHNYYTKKPNISNSISKNNNNKSISMENDEEIIDIIKSMENDNTVNKNKNINVESPVKFEKYNGYNYDNYIRMNRLKKKPMKEINSYLKNKDYSISLVDNSNTLKSMNTVRILEDENTYNYRKLDKREIKPYFRKVIRNATNNNNINNFNTKNINKDISQRTSTSSYFSINNNEEKRKHFNSLMANQFPLNINGRNKDKIYKISEPYLNTSIHESKTNIVDTNLYDKKDKNKYKYNTNNNTNNNTEQKEGDEKDKKLLNSMKEKKIYHNNNIFNIKKNIFSKNGKENNEKNDKKDKNINNQDNKEKKEEKKYYILKKDRKEENNNNKKNDEDKENKEDKKEKEKEENKENKENKEEKENKENKENKNNENNSNSDMNSNFSSNSYFNKRRERERQLLNRMRKIKDNNKDKDNINKDINEDKLNNSEIHNNKKDEKKKEEKNNKISYNKRGKEGKNEIKIINNNNNEPKSNIFSKRKYFVSNKKSTDLSFQTDEEKLNNNNIKNKSEKVLENQINTNKDKNTDTSTNSTNKKEYKYKSIRHKYMSKIHNKNNDLVKEKENENQKEKYNNNKKKEEKKKIFDKMDKNNKKNEIEEKGEEKIIVNKYHRSKKEDKNNIKKKDLKIKTEEKEKDEENLKNSYPTSSIFKLLNRTKTINNNNLELTKEELNLELPNNYIYNYNKRNRILKTIRTKDHSESREKEKNQTNIINKDILIPTEISYNTINTDNNNNKNNKERIIHSYHHRNLFKNKIKKNMDNNDNDNDNNNNINIDTNKTTNTIVINNNININFNNKIEPTEGKYFRNNRLKRNITDTNTNIDYFNKIIINETNNNSRQNAIIEKYDNHNNDKYLRRKNIYTGGTIECVNINNKDSNQNNSISSLLHRIPFYKKTLDNNKNILSRDTSYEKKHF